MNKNNISTGASTGGISILAIFVVLCLTTLATLSLVSARADLALAEKTMESSVEYYRADATAEEFVASIMRAADTGEGWDMLLLDAGYEVDISGQAALVKYDVPINDIKTLHVEIELTLNESGLPGGAYRRQCWETRVAGYEGEQRLNVLQRVEDS